MLETFVPSKIRRALLEYILTHPTHRFYLRGLAKELGLTISPLRRELKRLEALGVLKTHQEANIRFYVVEQASPHFARLKSAAFPELAPTPQIPAPQPLAPLVTSTVLSHAKVERIRKVLSPTLPWPILVGGLVGVVVLVMVGMFTKQAVVTPRSQAAVVESIAPRLSGEMQSPRWRLMPGTMGGFSARAGEGTY